MTTHNNACLGNGSDLTAQKYGITPDIEAPQVTRDRTAFSSAFGTSACSQQSSPEISISSSEADPLLPEHNSSTPVKIRRPAFVELLATPRLLAATLGAFMESFILTELESTVPLYIKRLFRYNSKDIAVVFLILSLPSFGAPVVGAMSDRYGAKIVVSTGFLCLTPFLILLRFINHYDAGQVVLLCFLLFAIGLSLNLILTPVFSDVTYALEEREAAEPGLFGVKGAYAQAFALMNIAYASGSLLGPLLGALLVEKVGWTNLTLATGIVCAACDPLCLYATGGKIANAKVWPKDSGRQADGYGSQT